MTTAIVQATSAEAARSSFDNLSGEIHSSTHSVLLGNTSLRNVMGARMQAKQSTAYAMGAVQPVMLASTGTAPVSSSMLRQPDTQVWANTWGFRGRINATTAAAKVGTSGMGLSAGVYLGESGGVAYSYLDINSTRNIWVPGLAGQLKADYKGHKVQAFVEGSTDVELGWQRAFGDTKANTTNRFANTNARFAAQGVGVGKNRALVGAGVQAQPAPNTSVSLGYQGQFGSGARDYAANLQVKIRFQASAKCRACAWHFREYTSPPETAMQFPAFFIPPGSDDQ